MTICNFWVEKPFYTHVSFGMLITFITRSLYILVGCAAGLWRVSRLYLLPASNYETWMFVAAWRLGWWNWWRMESSIDIKPRLRTAMDPKGEYLACCMSLYILVDCLHGVESAELEMNGWGDQMVSRLSRAVGVKGSMLSDYSSLDLSVALSRCTEWRNDHCYCIEHHVKVFIREHYGFY